MRKSFLIGLLLLLGLTTTLQAQTVQNNMGTSWLRIPDSVREGSLAGTLGAVPDEVDEATLNPAGLGLMGGTYLSGSHTFWIQDLSMEHLVFSQAGGGSGFSLGADYLDFGNVATYNVTGPNLIATGGYEPIGLNVYGATGFSLGSGLRGGLTAHYIFDDIQQNQPDNTVAVDAGILYQIPQNPLALSVVLANLGFNIDNSVLPLELKTSASELIPFGDPSKGSRLSLSTETDLLLTNTQFNNVGFGAEGWYNGLVALRVGYRFANTQDLSGVTGLAAGVGLRYQDWQLDYSFATLGDLGNTNQIALSLKLGSEITPTPTPTPVPTPPIPIVPAAPPMITLAPISTPTPVPTPVNTPVPTPTLTFMEYYRAGMQAYKQKDYPQALNRLMEAIVIRDPKVQPFYYAEACAMIGVVYKFDLPNPFLAHLFCNAALRIDPTTETAKKLSHEIDASTTPIEKVYWVGYEDFEKGRYRQAAKKFKQVIDAQDPTTPSFYYTETYTLLGVIYQYHLSDPTLAYRYYQKALKIDPKAKVANENIVLVRPPKEE